MGYTLDEITNDITQKTPACFEPTLDYVVVKIPKWQFEKFPGADESLGPQMKSVGEVMAIGRTFKESLLKAVRSLETGKRLEAEAIEPKILTKRLVSPHPERLQYVRYALSHGWTVPHVARLTALDPWFLYQLKEVGDELAALEKTLAGDDHGRGDARGQAQGNQRHAAERAVASAGARGRNQDLREAPGDGNCPGVQAGGYLRGGVRELYAIPVLDL